MRKRTNKHMNATQGVSLGCKGLRGQHTLHNEKN